MDPGKFRHFPGLCQPISQILILIIFIIVGCSDSLLVWILVPGLSGGAYPCIFIILSIKKKKDIGIDDG